MLLTAKFQIENQKKHLGITQANRDKYAHAIIQNVKCNKNSLQTD